MKRVNEKQILSNYLIREFDELNTLRSFDTEEKTDEEVKEDVKKAIKAYILRQFMYGQKDVGTMVGIAIPVLSTLTLTKTDPDYKSAAKLEKALIGHKIDGKTFSDRINDIENIIDPQTGSLHSDIFRIASTEGHRGYIEGETEGAYYLEDKMGRVVFKRWDATLDSRTRHTHVQLNSQMLRIGEYFTTPNGKALAPGKFGVAQEDVNCRCILTFWVY